MFTLTELQIIERNAALMSWLGIGLVWNPKVKMLEMSSTSLKYVGVFLAGSSHVIHIYLTSRTVLNFFASAEPITSHGFRLMSIFLLPAYCMGLGWQVVLVARRADVAHLFNQMLFWSVKNGRKLNTVRLRSKFIACKCAFRNFF